MLKLTRPLKRRRLTQGDDCDILIRRTKYFHADLSPRDFLNDNHHNNTHVLSSLPDSWETLPLEILVLIFIHLKAKEIQNVASVCKKWRQSVDSEQFWFTFYRIQFGGTKFDGRSWRFHSLFAQEQLEIIKKFGYLTGSEDNTQTFINNYRADTDWGPFSMIRVVNNHGDDIDEFVNGDNPRIYSIPRWIFNTWMWAAERGHYCVMNRLYCQGLISSLNVCDIATRRTALCRAVQSSHSHAVQWLLYAGAFVDCRKEDKATPLCIAAGKGNLDVVKMLVKADANMESADRAGGSPLMMACQNRQLDVIQYLLKLHCDVNRSLKDGETPLFVAAMLDYCDVIDILLDFNAEVNVARYNGATPFWIACKYGSVNAVRRLALISKVETDVFVQGMSCLEIALQESHPHVAKLLVQVQQKRLADSLPQQNGIPPVYNGYNLGIYAM